MQIKKSLRKKLYQKRGIDETEYSQEAYERFRILESVKKLREEGCSERTALEALKISRSAYYRWRKAYKELGLEGLQNLSRCPNNLRKSMWSSEAERLVLKVRQRFPLWGKNKIKVLLARDYGKKLSVSTVGRIITSLIKRKLILPVHYYYGRVRIKRPRDFKGHAKRWRYGMKATAPGEFIQVDHTTVTFDKGLSFKHFKAVDPITKITVEQLYTEASSHTAADFLAYAKVKFPFPIKSIQVDGGPEFMRDFEFACKKNVIPLYVLPPRSPRLNGIVERGNATVKYEFYYCYDGAITLPILREKLHAFTDFYNTFRPHQSLQYSTPWQYYQKLGALQSHM
jgi:putative transposase